MKVVPGLPLLLLLLLLCLCGVRGQDGGLFPTLDNKRADNDLNSWASVQSDFDMWEEIWTIKAMVVNLQNEMKDVEAQLIKSEVTISVMTTEVANNKQLISQLESEKEAQAVEIALLQERVTASESRANTLEEENKDLKTRMRNSETELLNNKAKVDQLERQNAEEKVAFSAMLKDGGKFGPFNTDVTLKFSKVLSNTGNAYNPATGFFTAPVKGVYYFQFTAFGFYEGSIAMQMYKNGKQILFNWGKTSDLVPEYLTNSVILELEAGDEIHMLLPSNHHLFDSSYNFTSFSGSLLFLL